MSLHPRPIEPIPAATAAVARQAFPKGERYILLREALSTIDTKAAFTTLFAVHGQSAISCQYSQCRADGTPSSEA